jgi:hypothetical protein
VVPAAPQPYPGASPALGAVLASITALSATDQAKLARAFRKAAAPLRLPGSAFRSWDEWWPVCRTARAAAAAELGERWHLDASTLNARIPAAWANIKLPIGGTKHGPRDIHCPAARFWPGGVLPSGVEYAERGAVDAAAGIPVTDSERVVRLRRRQAPNGWGVPTFEMEPTPEDIDGDLADAAD